jgi:hypothetical protein
MSHRFNVSSRLPENPCVPSGENATELTPVGCPLKVRNSCPLPTSHSLMVLSLLPESTRAPSGENATERT